MMSFILRRLMIAAVVLFAISVINFAFISLAPGDPLQAMLPREGGRATETVLQQAPWLNDSLPARYVRWLRAVTSGDLGESFRTRRPTTEIIAKAVPPTVLLAGTAMALSLLAGVPLGIITAYRSQSWLDHLSTVSCFVLTSIPGFFLALLAVFLLAVRFGWFPAGGMYTYNREGEFGDLIRHLILPATVLALIQVPVYIRFVRAAVLEIMGYDYVRTARAKGLREPAIARRHVLPNALSPLITLIGLSLPGLLGGSVLIEQVFAWPGLGTLSVQSALYRDYAVFMGVSLLYAAAVLVSNLIADILYAIADPRIRLS